MQVMEESPWKQRLARALTDMYEVSEPINGLSETIRCQAPQQRKAHPWMN